MFLLMYSNRMYPQDIITTRTTLSNEQVQAIIHESELTIQSILQREIYLPGLFFTPDGEAVDFRGTGATYRNIKLYKVCN